MFKSSSLYYCATISLFAALPPFYLSFSFPSSSLTSLSINTCLYSNLQRKLVIWPHWIRLTLFHTYASIMQISIQSFHITISVLLVTFSITVRLSIISFRKGKAISNVWLVLKRLMKLIQRKLCWYNGWRYFSKYVKKKKVAAWDLPGELVKI